MQKLFVYGTLGPNKPNQHIMEEIGGEWTHATIKGRLVEEGWGAEMGCPGLILDDKGDEIHGHIFSSPRLQDKWQYLDGFEGDGYERVLASVRLEVGLITQAYVYIIKIEAS